MAAPRASVAATGVPAASSGVVSHVCPAQARALAAAAGRALLAVIIVTGPSTRQAARGGVVMKNDGRSRQ